jgi:hypothetical protein
MQLYWQFGDALHDMVGLQSLWAVVQFMVLLQSLLSWASRQYIPQLKNLPQQQQQQQQ